jgi:hypothetical protein
MAEKFLGIRLGRKTIEHSRASRPFTGVTARIESKAEIDAREPTDRVVLSDGLAARLLKPEIAPTQPYLTVQGPDFEWSVALAPDQVAGARAFAGKVNEAVAAAAAADQ